MTYKLDLDLSPHSFTKGGIQCFLNWDNKPDGEGTEPAMVFRRTHGDTQRLSITRMSELPGVLNSNGFGMLGLVSMSVMIAESLGFSRLDRAAASSIADLILDCTDELYDLPNDPPDKLERAIAGQMAELSIQMDGQTVMETEVAV